MSDTAFSDTTDLNMSETVFNDTISTQVLTTDTSHSTDTYNVISAELFLTLYKIFYTGIIPATILVGIIGNSLTFIVFCRINNWTTSSINLFCLTLADTLALCSNSVVVILINLRTHLPTIGVKIYAIMAPHFIAATFYIFGRIASVLPVLIAFERLVAIAFPLHAKRILTKRVTISLIISAVVFVGAYNIPKYFILETFVTYNNVSGMTTYGFRETEFGQDDSFWIPHMNMEIILFRIIPAFSTAIFNAIMLTVLFKSSRRRRKMTRIAEITYQSSDELKEMRVTRTIFAVTFIYTLCSLPRAINRLLTIADPNSELYSFSNNAQRLFTVVTFELDNINSSVNFIVYITTSQLYRQGYKLICGCVNRQKSTSSSNVSKSQETIESFSSLPM